MINSFSSVNFKSPIFLPKFIAAMMHHSTNNSHIHNIEQEYNNLIIKNCKYVIKNNVAARLCLQYSVSLSLLTHWISLMMKVKTLSILRKTKKNAQKEAQSKIMLQLIFILVRAKFVQSNLGRTLSSIINLLLTTSLSLVFFSWNWNDAMKIKNYSG